MLIAAMAASPYTAHCAFSTIVERLFSACLSRLGKPVAMMLRTFTIRPRSVFFRLSFDSVFPVRNIESRMSQLTIWLIAVDSPAPAILRSSANISIGSPIMFSTAPVIRPTIPSAALPS